VPSTAISVPAWLELRRDHWNIMKNRTGCVPLFNPKRVL
jgi:hypothetical protein